MFCYFKWKNVGLEIKTTTNLAHLGSKPTLVYAHASPQSSNSTPGSQEDQQRVHGSHCPLVFPWKLWSFRQCVGRFQPQAIRGFQIKDSHKVEFDRLVTYFDLLCWVAWWRMASEIFLFCSAFLGNLTHFFSRSPLRNVT